MRVLRLMIVIAVGAAVLAPSARAACCDTLLVSRLGLTGAGGDAASRSPAVSADGRYVAFDSDADNLSTEDDDTVTDVFVRDMQTGTTTLVSRADGAAGAAADAAATGAAISADGRYVAFRSGADNLSTEDNDLYTNIFVRDVIANTTTLVSRNDLVGADGHSAGAAISADGRFVAFESAALNLSAIDADAAADVFVRDLQGGAGATMLVSHNGSAGGDGTSSDPDISADGRHVAFMSAADNLSTDDNDSFDDIFVRDLQTGAMTLASRGDSAANDHSGYPSISSDARFVAFESNANNLSGADNDAVTNVFVRDVQGAGATLLASRNGATAGDGSSFFPSISDDGRIVAFESSANNLSDADDDTKTDIFAHDTRTGLTALASRAPGTFGAAADGNSSAAAVSGGGRHVAFQSVADNLSDTDTDLVSDAFVRHVGGPPICTDVARSLARGVTSASLTLPCSDPDSDPFSYSIVSGPAHGTLGGIDQATGAVTYTVAAGYPGPDSFTFKAVDVGGDSNVATVTLTVAGPEVGPGGGPGAIDLAPRITGLRVTNRRFALARGRTARTAAVKRGTTFVWTLSEDARTTIRIARRRGARFVTVFTLTRARTRKGVNRVKFTGRVGKRRLAAGRYRATVTATDAAGKRSAARTVSFSVVRG